ncbi:MAG: antibiotic biosynthesis monooxygenase [Clostridia bacterium]|nr:antibiotic biosynthesis monooxygenase [Clostridia bacterium]
MIEIKITYKLQPEMKHKFMETVENLGIPQATRNEKGCLKYDFDVSADKDEVYLNELWENEECLESHKTQPHLKKLVALKEEFLIETVADFKNI